MKKLIALMTTLTLLLFSFAAMAETTTLKVGISPDFPPFESLDDQGKLVGFDIDMASEVAKDLGVTLDYVTAEFSDIIPGVAKGQFDLGISAFSITQERLADVDFSAAYLENGLCCIVRADSGITDQASLMGLKIGVQTGTTSVEEAENCTDEDSVSCFVEALDAVKELQAGRLDAVITDSPVATRILKELADSTLIISDTIAFETETYGIVLPKGNEELKAKIDASIQRMTEDGTLEALAQKWDIFDENPDITETAE